MGIIDSTLPIAILIFLGYFLKNYWIKDQAFWTNINKLIYYIMFPALIIYDISQANLNNINPLFIVVLVSVVVLITALICLVKPLFKQTSFWLVFAQGSVRYNSYIFIGVTVYYIGRQTMPIIALITAFLVIAGNVVSVFLLDIYSGKKKSVIKSTLSMLKNPLIVACIFSLCLNKVAVHIPFIIHIDWLNNTLNYMGEASLPLSLIGVGASLNFNISLSKLNGVLICSFIKLIVSPALVITALKLMHFDNALVEVCMIYAGAPCSTNATAMNESMGADHQSMSLIISTQTVLSIFTLTGWMLFFPYLT